MAKLVKQIGVRVSPEFFRRVQRAAKFRKRRPSDFARIAVEDAVEAAERENPALLVHGHQKSSPKGEKDG